MEGIDSGIEKERDGKEREGGIFHIVLMLHMPSWLQKCACERVCNKYAKTEVWLKKS